MPLRVLLRVAQILRAYRVLLQAQNQLNDKGLAWLEERLSFTCEQRPENLSDGHKMNLAIAVSWHESVRLAARLPLWKTENIPACLPKALALHSILRARDLSPVLSLGVSKRGRQLASHAWVELYGQMIGEPDNVADDFVRVNARTWPLQSAR